MKTFKAVLYKSYEERSTGVGHEITVEARNRKEAFHKVSNYMRQHLQYSNARLISC